MQPEGQGFGEPGILDEREQERERLSFWFASFFFQPGPMPAPSNTTAVWTEGTEQVPGGSQSWFTNAAGSPLPWQGWEGGGQARGSSQGGPNPLALSMPVLLPPACSGAGLPDGGVGVSSWGVSWVFFSHSIPDGGGTRCKPRRGPMQASRKRETGAGGGPGRLACRQPLTLLYSLWSARGLGW